MNVNRHIISSCRSLPPNVEGELNGALTMQVDEILWFNKITTNDAVVYVRWWGELQPVKFRPLHCTHCIDSDISVVHTYRIYTVPQLFYSYLEDSKQLILTVVDERSCSPIGHATLCNLRETFTEQSTKQICVPVVDGHGVKIAELCLSLTLKFFENIANEIDSTERTVPSVKFSSPKVLSVPPPSVPDSLVIQLLQRARRLRDAMAKSVLQDWEDGDIHQCPLECHHASVSRPEKLLKDLLGVDDDVVQQEVMEVLNKIRPTSELLDLVTSPCESLKDAGCGSEPKEKYEVPVNRKRQSNEVAEGSLMKSVARDEKQHLTSSLKELLETAVSMRVCVTSLYLQKTPKSSGTYFVDYEVPEYLVTGHTPLSRTTCSRRLVGKVVHFGQRFVHTLSKQEAPLAHILRDTCLLFKVFCRQLSERKRSLVGQATMSLAQLTETEQLEVHQELAVRGLGKLRVIVQLGCDKAQVGRHQLVEGRDVHQLSDSGQTLSTDNASQPTGVENQCLQISGLGQRDQSSTNVASHNPHKSSQHQLLYALLHIPCGHLTTPCNSSLTCRAFWRDHVLTSDVARDSCDPCYDFHQVLPILLSPELLERCRENVLIVEAWERMPGADPDILLGLAKISLHPFYLAYKDPILVSQLLRAKFPVVSADKWVPVVCPSSGTLRGELNVLLAMGSEDQVLSLGTKSGSVLRSANDSSVIPPVPQGAGGDTVRLPTTMGAGNVPPGNHHDSVLQNAELTKDVHPLPKNRVEFSGRQTSPPRHHAQQNKVYKNVNFAESSRMYEYTHESGVPAAQTNLREAFTNVTGLHSEFDMHQHGIPASRDIVMSGQESPPYTLPSSETKENQTYVLQNCDSSDICSSHCSSDSSSIDARNKKESTALGAAGDVNVHDAITSSLAGSRGDMRTILSDLQKNLMMLNLAGGDTLQLESLAALREQSYAADHELAYKHLPGIEKLQQMTENTPSDQVVVDCISPGHSGDTRSTNVKSFSGFSGEVGCRDSVTAGCSTDSQIASEKSSTRLSNSMSMEQAEESSETFSARVKVDQAVDLKLKAPWCGSDDTKVYVTFQANDNSLQPLTSPAAKVIEGPAWGWSCDTQLTVNLLNKEDKRLVMKVWHMAGELADAAADTVLGFAVVDLTSLSRGFSFVSGWYNLVDYAGSCVGKIEVTVTPLEDVSRFNLSTLEMELPAQESHDPSESDLYSSLKEKLGELDEITARLRLRLDTVVSDEGTLQAPSTDIFAKVLGLNNDTDATPLQDHAQEDKCVQTSVYDDNPDSWTDWLMGMPMRDLELENVFNPMLFQPLISSSIGQSRSRQNIETACKAADPGKTSEQVASQGCISRPQTVAERLQTLWQSSDDLACLAARQAPDGVSICENSTSVSKVSVSEDEKKTKKT